MQTNPVDWKFGDPLNAAFSTSPLRGLISCTSMDTIIVLRVGKGKLTMHQLLSDEILPHFDINNLSVAKQGLRQDSEAATINELTDQSKQISC